MKHQEQTAESVAESLLRVPRQLFSKSLFYWGTYFLKLLFDVR